MVDRVNVTTNHQWNTPENARTFRYCGKTDGFVMPGTTPLLRDVSPTYDSDGDGVDDTLATGAYEEFNHMTGDAANTGLDVVIGTGEAVVKGLPLARDTRTTVTLADNTANQTVYVGWVDSGNDNILIGTQADFDALTAYYDYLPLWEFDTSSGAVTAARSKRVIGDSLDLKNTRYETTDSSGIKVDKSKSSDTAGNATTANSADQADAIRDAGDGTVRDVYVKSTEPTNWVDGDLWFQPE